jgi:DNA repair photolyase
MTALERVDFFRLSYCTCVQYHRHMPKPTRSAARPGRGATSNPPGRFETTRTELEDDGWGLLDEELPPFATTVTAEPARTIISRNTSPDIAFDQSINPYKGCEHGCIYCYARPSHAYLNLSPGLDFETKLFYKPDAAKLLEKELAAPDYVCSPITIGANTDPYQPIEKEYRVTRSIIEVLAQCQHPFSIITKSALIERDVDLMAPLAANDLVHAFVSVTTLSNDVKRTLEPRTASPGARLRAIKTLSSAGIPVGVMVAPIVPVITDSELEHILEAAAQAGARTAGYVVLRLPHELSNLFREWLEVNEPLKAKHVLSRLNALHGGRGYDSSWGRRQSGQGEYASLLKQRFARACARCDLKVGERFVHNVSLFRPPCLGPQQLALI